MKNKVIERYAQKGETVTSIKPATSFVKRRGRLTKAYEGFVVNEKVFVSSYSLMEYDLNDFDKIIKHC